MIYVAIAVIIVVFICLKFYLIKYDTVIAFTGGLGSGKSFNAVKVSIKLLKRNRRKVAFYNFFHRRNKREMPLLYSSIPIYINKKLGFSVDLTVDHLLLTSRIVPRSVVFIDEVGSFCSQFDYNNPNIRDNFDEFVRLFRHYTLGGYLVITDQCSENIVLQIRRRINTVFNLMHFKKWFGLVWTCRCRNISISEEIKTIEEQNAEDNARLLIGFLPIKTKHYDTYCYSERYNTVESLSFDTYKKLKKNRLLNCPKSKKPKQTNDKED